MNISLIGYGKMGKMIASLCGAEQKIVSIIDPADPAATHKKIDASALASADVVIDFSAPASAISNVGLVSQHKKNIVMGTTGWYNQLDAVRQIVMQSGIGFLYSSNFSIGVQLFLQLVERGGELFNKFPQYDVFAHEFHHRHKGDSPSGTAISVGKAILKTVARKKEILSDTSHDKIDPAALHLTSTRGGAVPGTHEVFFDSEADTIEIRHTARSRAGFASGALEAAKWLVGKKGFFSMEDYVKFLIG